MTVDPSYPEAHYNLGTLLAKSGRMDEAMEHLNAAVRVNPDNAYYQSVLGIEYAKQGLINEAIERFEIAVRLAPEEPAYRRNLERAKGMRKSSGGEKDR